MSTLEKRLARRLAFVTPGMHPAIVSGLERLSEDGIDGRLADLKRQSSRVCLLVSTTFSDELDKDGGNLNRTIRPAAWWHATIARHFPDARLFAGPEHESCVILSWTPNLAARLIIGHERRRQSLLRRLDRYRSQRLQRRFPDAGLGESAILALLRGKSVALIGNSRALGERRDGTEIDGHDIVIRCNRAPIIQTSSHGARTDWIATSIGLAESLPEMKGASHILWMSPRRDRMPAWLVGFPRLFLYPKDRNKTLEALAGARPSTGLMVIDLLLGSECTKIDLFGFDFFKSESVSGDRTKASAPHDFDGEEALVHAWSVRDGRLAVRP